MALSIQKNITIIGFEGEPSLAALVARISHDPQVEIEGNVTICLIPRDAPIAVIEAMTAAVNAKPSATLPASKA